MSKLNQIEYPRISEKLFYSQLKNGMKLVILPKKMFAEKSAMLTVNFGSIYNRFTSRKLLVEAPEGLAHFLEHKLFEGDSGQDLSLKFTDLGADVNAFTTFDKTSYYFSGTSRFMESLTLLQELVMTAHFTEESINREKKIISQEIDMYSDDPDYQSYIGILQNLFPNSSLSKDIVGTKDSISEIDCALLQRHYRQFYYPANMTLIISGDLDPQEVLDGIIEGQKSIRVNRLSRFELQALDYNPVIRSNSIAMDIVTPKLVVGYRGQKLSSEKSLMEYKIALKFLLAMLMGWTSKTYQDWYNDSKIDDSFDIEIEIQHDFSFILISMDTSEPIAMSSRVRKKIAHFLKSKDINNGHLSILKREMFGDFMQGLDSIDHLMNQFNLFLSDNENFYDVPDLIDTMTLERILEIGQEFFGTADISDFTVFPK
ncbi:pitrilysin family protein [Streptococcus iniae]|nr:pitrilysin family protein [Streptococcus iniae]